VGKMKNVQGSLTLKGVGGQVSVDEHWLTIHRKGGLAKVNQGLKGEKRIPLKNITAVQFKEAGATNGYIQFSLLGGNEAMSGILGATKDENTVVFTSFQKDDARAIRDFVEHFIVHGVAPATVLPTAEEVPAGWRPDPLGRFDYRWWDGSDWTENVSKAGVVSVDALPVEEVAPVTPWAPPPPPPPS
jgi:hypothetical protein